MGDNSNSPCFAVIFEDDPAKSPREVFKTVKEASKISNSPEGKILGARFRKFRNEEEAHNFLSSGDFPQSPLATPSTKLPVSGEPAIPSPSLKLTDYTVLKKTIEKDDLGKFCELVESNPRYLINTSGDTAAILVEGSRYNAMHIASRCGKSLFVSTIISYIADVEFIKRCYGTDDDDARLRQENIIDSMLNTPDKIPLNTPLHFAAKLGHVDVVKALLTESRLKKTLKNKEGKTPLEEACSSYHGDDKAARKKEIELLLNGFFVALYRTTDNSAPVKLVMTENVPKAAIEIQFEPQSPLREEYYLAAYAGPFFNKMEVENFYQKWNQSGKDIKRSDHEKGYERIGRELAKGSGVSWAESWFFLPKSGPINFENPEHLAIVNNYFGSLRSGKLSNDPVKAKLNFDDDDDKMADDDEFEDALEYPPLNDSLGSLTDIMSALSLNSPKRITPKRESSEDDYTTPPSTPPPVYILGLPTKSDSDLHLALSIISDTFLEAYPHIRFFMSKIAQMGQKKSEWPSKDSPRVNHSRIPRRFQRI